MKKKSISAPLKTGFFTYDDYEKYKFVFKIYNYIKFILVSPLIVLHLITYPFLKIKLGWINTKSIGNSTTAFEIFNHENKYKKNEIILWFTDNLVANKFWVKKIKKQYYFIPGIIGTIIYDFYSQFKFFQNLIVPTRNFNSCGDLDLIKKKTDLSALTDIYGVIKDNEPLIKFNKKEIEAGENFLKNNNINKDDKIICIHNRSSSYRNEKFTAVKNSSIKNFEKSINFLTNLNCKVIRMGRDENDIILPNNNNFINYASSKDQSDFLDFYLISKCKFLVSAASGIVEIAVAMRKPILIHNYFPLIKLIHVSGDYKRIILPKKIINIKTKKILSFTDMLTKDSVNIQVSEDLENSGIDLIENTDSEILDSVEEMYNLIINKKEIDLDQTKFMINFKKMFYGIVPNLKIASNFYKENIDLFEKKY